MNDADDVPRGSKQIKATRRVLRLIELLAGKEFDGVRPGELAKALGVNAATITRDMADLADEGFAERVPGREEAWRLGPKTVQIFRAHCIGLDRIDQRVSEMNNRYSRSR